VGCGGIAPPFLSTALDGGKLSASRSYRFTPGGTAHSTHWIGGWVGLRTTVDAMENTNMFCSCRNSNPVPRYFSPIRYTH
jgi:hypothetical protein